MKFSAVLLFIAALGDLRLLPDRAHGLVLGRPGRDRRRRQGAWLPRPATPRPRRRPRSTRSTADAGLAFQWGALDFAGGTVVHINAGIAGLVGALIIGKRVGYGKEPMPPHSLTHDDDRRRRCCGSAGSASTPARPSRPTARRALAMINTFVATAAAALAWMFVEWIVKGKPRCSACVSGAVAGLVAVTPACGFAGPMGAIVLGLVAGVVCFFFVLGRQERARLRRRARRVRRPLRRRHPRRARHRHPGQPRARRRRHRRLRTKPASVADYDMVAQVIAQVKAVLPDAGLVGHRLGDPLQDRRRDRRPARRARSRSAKASTSPITASAPTTTEPGSAPPR